MVFFSLIASGQEGINYDETKVPSYRLPDPLLSENGKAVTTAGQWERKQRPRLLGLFEDQVYGKQPRRLKVTRVRILEEGSGTPYPNGFRRQVELVLEKGSRSLSIHLLIYLPMGGRPVPVFLGYNFEGNHTVSADEAVLASGGRSEGRESGSEAARGSRATRWPVQRILDAGYGVATLWYEEVDPDRNDFSDGVHSFAYRKGEERPSEGEWGSLAAWAWGLSRVLDYLETDPAVDAGKVFVLGHSRLGKAALWAGAIDTRFAMVISNESGCGGAALSRRKFGETLQRINSSFPHWFCTNFKTFSNLEEELPVDQHQLIALIAPRPVYIASAVEDLWADPRGEYLSGFHASPVYQLYGLTGLESPLPPPVNQPVMNHIGYHLREGTHDLTPYDWEQFIRFADLHFNRKK